MNCFLHTWNVNVGEQYSVQNACRWRSLCITIYCQCDVCFKFCVLHVWNSKLINSDFIKSLITLKFDTHTHINQVSMSNRHHWVLSKEGLLVVFCYVLTDNARVIASCWYAYQWNGNQRNCQTFQLWLVHYSKVAPTITGDRYHQRPCQTWSTLCNNTSSWSSHSTDASVQPLPNSNSDRSEYIWHSGIC